MIYNVIESKFPVENIKESMLLFDPTQDMHDIENWEDHLDKNHIAYALVECRQVVKTKDYVRDVFVGWALATALPLFRDERRDA